MGDWVGDDGYDYEYRRSRRRPSPHHMRTDYRDDYLNPGQSSGLYRSRSQGHGPAPTINVYNRMTQDNDQPHFPGAFPGPAPPPVAYPPQPQAMPMAYPVAVPTAQPAINVRYSPEPHRGRRDRLGEDIAEGFADLAIENARLRSRSRGRSDYSDRAMAEWQLAQREQELKDMERRQQWEHEEQRIRNEVKLKNLEAELKREREEDALKEREARYVSDYERKRREKEEKEREEERRILDRAAKREKEEKEKALAMEQEFLRKQEEKKKKEEEQYKEFERIQREREEKKKQKAKEEEEHIQHEMRKRLEALGYSQQTIDIMVDEEKIKKYKSERSERERSRSRGERITTFEETIRTRAPVYPKVHKDYLAVETLKYYNLPWEYDRANSDYIIILKDMTTHQTDVLFEHTKKLRGKLLLEAAPKKDKEFAWVRHRSKSRHGADRIGIIRVER